MEAIDGATESVLGLASDARARPGHLALPTADVDRLADEIAELSAHLDAATHRLLTLIRRFDACSGWYRQGALSCAAWLSWRIGLDLCAAREKVRVARALGSLPHIDAALRRGQVSYSKVRALTRVATAENVDASRSDGRRRREPKANNEALLLEMARSATAAQLERICRGYRRAVNGILGKLTCDEASQRWVRDRSTESGMIRIECQLMPEEAAVVLKAIERAWERAWPGERDSAEDSAPADHSVESTRRPKLSRADALVIVAEDYLASTVEAGGPPVEVIVHVEADSLADPASAEAGTLDDGTSLPRATVERLACDAAVVTRPRGPKRQPARRRAAPPHDSHRAPPRAPPPRPQLSLPGCENRRVDGHHVVPWSRGGATKLANLASPCRSHHRYVHELGFRIERRDDGRFAFFAPAGWEVKPTCAAPPLGRDPVAALLRRSAAAGMTIDDRTSFPRWDGTPPDYDHIVHVIATKYPALPG